MNLIHRHLNADKMSKGTSMMAQEIRFIHDYERTGNHEKQ